MKCRWQRFTDKLIGKRDYFFIDTTSYSFFIIIKKYIDKYVKGRVLDAGAGRLALKFLLAPKATTYYSIDKYIARKELSIVGDLNILPIKEKTFDTIVCLQVIEHTPTPEHVIKDLAVSLKDKGILILSAPHIAYLHGEPEDYYRYTKYGLIYMLEKHGFRVLEISAAGSIFGFLFTPVSDIILSYSYSIPVVFQIVFFLNSICVRFVSRIELLLFGNSIMPTNYIVAAERVS